MRPRQWVFCCEFGSLACFAIHRFAILPSPQQATFATVEYAWNVPLNVSDWQNTTEIYPTHPRIPGVLFIDEFGQPSNDPCYEQVLQQLEVSHAL